MSLSACVVFDNVPGIYGSHHNSSIINPFLVWSIWYLELFVVPLAAYRSLWGERKCVNTFRTALGDYLMNPIQSVAKSTICIYMKFAIFHHTSFLTRNIHFTSDTLAYSTSHLVSSDDDDDLFSDDVRDAKCITFWARIWTLSMHSQLIITIIIIITSTNTDRATHQPNDIF